MGKEFKGRGRDSFEGRPNILELAIYGTPESHTQTELIRIDTQPRYLHFVTPNTLSCLLPIKLKPKTENTNAVSLYGARPVS